MAYTIAIAGSDQEIAETFDVIKQLRPHLNQQDYVEFIRRLQIKYYYHLLYLTYQHQVVAVAGFRVNENLSCGKHIYIDDLVSDEAHQSMGYGHALIEWIVEYAKQLDCSELHLDSGVQRYAAHRFYFRERFEIVYYHFKKVIS